MGFHNLLEDIDTIPYRKQINDRMREAQRKVKPEKCILCGKPQNGYCNSHSVPQMILRNIAQDGKVLQANALIDIEVIDKENGINKSGTFYMICDECDHIYFRDYENPENLHEKPTDRMMAEIALKNTLIKLYKQMTAKELITSLQRETGRIKHFEIYSEATGLDIRDYREEIDLYKSIINNDDTGCFQILFWKKLPYVTPIAAQTMFALPEDLNGGKLNDIYDFSKDIRMEEIHVCVFPLEDETIVLVFCHKKDRKCKALLRQFKMRTDAEDLQYINWMVFKYSEDYFMSKSILPVVQADQKLQRISQDDAGFPHLGMYTISDLLQDGEAVTCYDIPNFLDKQFEIT